jgi:hypothetical protein
LVNSRYGCYRLSLDSSIIKNNGYSIAVSTFFLQPKPKEKMKLTSALWVLGCLLFSPLLCAEDSSVEYQVKAGYLYNFTKFITWSADKTGAFNLCIVGNDPFGELIDPIEKRSVNGLPIKLFRFDSLGSIDKGLHCHMVYVSSSVKESPGVRNFDNTLVVGEGGEFVEQGGMIGFVKKQDKIKLYINRKKIEQNSLKISAKLLEVADDIKGDTNE